MRLDVGLGLALALGSLFYNDFSVQSVITQSDDVSLSLRLS